jgi:signal transduction histidine kinase
MTGQGPSKEAATPEQAERLHHFAHDLRNRLAGIQQVLAQFDDATPSDRVQLIEFAEQQYFRAMRSTEELLDAFAVERGVGTLSMGKIDLTSLMNDAIAAMQHRFERKAQVVHAEMKKRVLVSGDAHWLKELVLALVSNASKFGTAGGRIQVSLHEESSHAVLTVTDDGAGMDADDLAQVFVRYAWLKSRPTTGEAQGRSTLSRAKQWAEAHQGTLTAHSEGAGKGSLFTLRLPLAP